MSNQSITVALATCIAVTGIATRAHADASVWQVWGAAHYQLSTDFGAQGPHTQAAVIEAGSTVPFYGIEGIVRVGGAWGYDNTSSSWSGVVVGGSIGWRIPLVILSDRLADQTWFTPSFGLSADAYIQPNGTVAGRGGAYLMNTSWITDYLGIQVRVDVGFVPQPFPFSVGIGFVVGKRAGVTDICGGCG